MGTNCFERSEFFDVRVQANDPRKVGRLGGARAHRRVQALLDQHDEFLLAHPLAPAPQRRPVERQLVDEELPAAEKLIVWVLDPARAQLLVGQIMRMLEDREPAISRVGSGG